MFYSIVMIPSEAHNRFTFFRKGLMRVFSRLGFEVDEAENGMQGFKMLKNRLYDIVLLDFLMPVVDGPDLARKFRAWEKDHRPDFHQVSYYRVMSIKRQDLNFLNMHILLSFLIVYHWDFCTCKWQRC
jgi:hypothetical protein